VVQTLVEDLTAALDQPVGVKQQARTGFDAGAGLGIRRTARDTQRAASAVGEVADALGFDQQGRRVPGAGPAQISGQQVQDHHGSGRGQRTGDAHGHSV
jgi:hypothetical protein